MWKKQRNFRKEITESLTLITTNWLTLITILWIDIQNSKKISEMTAKDLKNNYQNVIIILICFGLHIGLSNYLYTFAKNLELVLSMRFISNCFANLLITSPIWVGNALLNDGKSYWQRLGLGSNIKEALVVIGLLTLLLSPFLFITLATSYIFWTLKELCGHWTSF